MIGDIVKPKIMIVGGMILCGLASIFFSLFNQPMAQIAFFALLGFSLSMLRGPLVKTISENTKPNHSRIICTFFSCASFTGPLIASLISIFFDWRKTFFIAGTIAFIVGILVYIIFTSFEKKGFITYALSRKTNGVKSIFAVFKLKHFVFYLFVGAVAEISAASISFWIPTYFTEQLCITENLAKGIFSIMSFVKGVTPFITLFMFHIFKEQDIKLARLHLYWQPYFL